MIDENAASVVNGFSEVHAQTEKIKKAEEKRRMRARKRLLNQEHGDFLNELWHIMHGEKK